MACPPRIFFSSINKRSSPGLWRVRLPAGGEGNHHLRQRLQKLLDALEEQIRYQQIKIRPFLRHAIPFWMKPYGRGRISSPGSFSFPNCAGACCLIQSTPDFYREIENLCHQVRVMIGEKSL